MTNAASSSRDAPKSGSSKAQKVKTEAKAIAKEGARAIESRAESMATMGMARAEKELRGLSRALESTRSELAQEDNSLAGAFGTAHERIDNFARGLADRDPGQLVGDAERIARRSPWLFLGGCFIGGVALSRFLKASGSSASSSSASQSGRGEFAFPPDMPSMGAPARDDRMLASTPGPGGVGRRGGGS